MFFFVKKYFCLLQRTNTVLVVCFYLIVLIIEIIFNNFFLRPKIINLKHFDSIIIFKENQEKTEYKTTLYIGRY